MSLPHPYTIENLNITDNLEDLGFDTAQFEFNVIMNGECYFYFITFFDLIKHSKQYFPAEAEYFNQVRKNIPRFGPKHTKMLAIMNEENFDIMPILCHYMDTNCKPEYLLKPVVRPKEDQQKIDAAFKDLQQSANDMKSFNLRDTEFSDDAMQYLTNKAIEIFPEIINNEPHYINDLHGILVTHIMRMATDITNLASSASDDMGE